MNHLVCATICACLTSTAAAAGTARIAAHLPPQGALPYFCASSEGFAIPLALDITPVGEPVLADDTLEMRFRELFSKKPYRLSRPVGRDLSAGETAVIRAIVTDEDLALVPGAYHLVVDLLRGGVSRCEGRVGSTLLYVKRPGESPQHILGSMGLAPCIFTRNRRNGGYFHVNNAELPPTYDPFSPDTYHEFIAAFGANTDAAPETHTDGGLGLLYMAKAFRAMGETERAAYAEDELKWLLDGCFDFYSMRCGGAAMTMHGWSDRLAYDPDGPIDGRPGRGPRSQWGCPVEGEPPVWTVSLPREIELERVVVDFGSPQSAAPSFDLEISRDGEQYAGLREVRDSSAQRLELSASGQTASFLRLRFLEPPPESDMYVLDAFEAWERPAESREPARNWADLDLDAVCSATRTHMPTMANDWLDTDQAAGILQLAARAALHFREHDPGYARQLFSRCERPARWIIFRSWTPDTESGLPLHRYWVKRESRERGMWGWLGYDGRVVEGVAWYCAAYPLFHDGSPPPAFFLDPAEACRDRIMEISAEHDGGYMPMPDNHCPHLAHQYITSALIACLAAEGANGLAEKADATAAWCAKMIAKMTAGYPTGITGPPHMPFGNSGDTGPHYFYSLVEYLSMCPGDAMAEAYVARLPDFVWLRMMPTNGALREAGHRAAVPSTAIWVCPEHVAANAEE